MHIRRRAADMAVGPALGAATPAHTADDTPRGHKRNNASGDDDEVDDSVATAGDAVGTVSAAAISPSNARRKRRRPNPAGPAHAPPVAPPFWLLGGTVPQTPHKLGLRRVRGARTTRVYDCLSRPILPAHAPSNPALGCGWHLAVGVAAVEPGGQVALAVLFAL